MFENKYKNKRLLILGGAAQCKKVVEAAHELGIYVIINDIKPNKDTSEAADETLTFSLYDFDLILDWCKKNPVDGIVNYCVDAAQHTYQKLCEALNKPCFGNGEQFRFLTDKNAFKKMCLDNGVDVIPTYSREEAEHGNVEFPVLVKPAESSGSRGASICNNKEELSCGLKKACDISLNGQVVIEKYMGNYQDFTMTYVFSDGEPYLIRTGDRFLGRVEDGLNRQCICTQCPSRYTDVFLENVNGKVINMLKKLGIKNGPVFMQGFVDGKTVRFYDPGFRFPGGEYDRLYRQATGINITKSIVCFALGKEKVELDSNVLTSYLLNGKTSIQLTVASRPGTIATFSGLDEIRKYPGVVYASQKAFAGDSIPASGDIKQRIAEIALLIDNKQDVIVKSLDDIYGMLKVLDESGNDMIVSKYNY